MFLYLNTLKYENFDYVFEKTPQNSLILFGALEPNWVNPVLIIIGVNSLRLGGLNMISMTIVQRLIIYDKLYADRWQEAYIWDWQVAAVGMLSCCYEACHTTFDIWKLRRQAYY